MKTTVIACTLLAGSLGFGTFASAQDRDGRRDHDRRDRAERVEQRQDRREQRQARRERREDRSFRQGYQAGTYQQPRALYQLPRAYQQPRAVYQQPSYNYGYSAPQYYGSSSQFSRGGYLPHQYRQQGYYVSNWNHHAQLYAPPHGHQWMQVGNDYLLVALATGLIANLLAN